MSRRMLPPTQTGYQTRTVNGRTYSGSPGSAFDIPDFDADVLSANGWIDIDRAAPRVSDRPAA